MPALCCYVSHRRHLRRSLPSRFGVEQRRELGHGPMQPGLDRAAWPAEDRCTLGFVEVEQIPAGHHLLVGSRQASKSADQLGAPSRRERCVGRIVVSRQQKGLRLLPGPALAHSASTGGAVQVARLVGHDFATARVGMVRLRGSRSARRTP